MESDSVTVAKRALVLISLFFFQIGGAPISDKDTTEIHPLKKYNRNTSFKSISGTAEEREKANKPTKQFSTAETILA